MSKKHKRNTPKTKAQVTMPPVQPIKKNLTTAEMEKLVADATNPATQRSWPVYPDCQTYWYVNVPDGETPIHYPMSSNSQTYTTITSSKVEPKVIPDNPSVTVKCECSCSQLEVEFDQEDNWFYFSMWYRGGQTQKMDWRNRIRWAWNILTKGNLWTDHMILSRENADKLSKFLQTTVTKP
jgi:hypothetical protein